MIHYNRTDKGSTALNCAFNVWASDFYTPVEILKENKVEWKRWKTLKPK